MSVALLIFSLNEVERVHRSIDAMRGIFDEIVLVDSSSPSDYESLHRLIVGSGVKAYRAIPMGFPEPLRPFGLSKVKSDFALILDADEEPTDRLKRDLALLNECAAYVLPRLEVELRSYTYHLRLMRPSAVRFSRRSFDFPEVQGRTGRLGKTHSIVHQAKYSNYFGEKSRAERYFTIEGAERPFTRSYLQEALTLRFGNRSAPPPFVTRLRENPDAPLSPAMIRAVIETEYLRDIFLGKGHRAASFNRRYSLGKRHFLLDLPDSDREFLRAVSQDIRQNGGLFSYLGFDNPAYVEQLTSSFRWNLRGIEVYKRLLRYRHQHGRPADHVPLAL